MDAASCHLLSLASVLCKIFEKNSKCLSLVPHRDTILYTQPTWLPCLSILLVQLFLQEERVTRLMEGGQTVDIVYLDFAKAFDSVSHRFLLAKLRSVIN